MVITREENSKYHQEVLIPVKIIKSEKVDSGSPQRKIYLGLFKQFLKKAANVVLIVFIISSQVLLLSAFEAHVINVTAHICRPLETRTMGFWKNHPEVYLPLLPQFLGIPPSPEFPHGYERISTESEVTQVFLDYDLSMRNKLRGQLLAMKFNIVHFGIGEYIPQGDTRTLDEIVAEADILLQNPDTPDYVLEEMKTFLDNLNNIHELRECVPSSTFSSTFFDSLNSLFANLSSFSGGEVSNCEPGQTQSCSTDQQGICSTGIQTCTQEGLWEECVQNEEPLTEACDDGLDNDCDGYVDGDDSDCQPSPTGLIPECEPGIIQPCDTGQLGICATGTQTCDGEGFWDECIAENGPATEICDNQIDDDCDDVVDCDDSDCVDVPECVVEIEPECVPDETQSCDTNQLGVCAAGTQTCDQESFWAECVADNEPAEEICDNELDDDCDGDVDSDDSDCQEPEPTPECTPEETQSCDTGEVGICVAGTQTCDENGFWEECIADNGPATEICDNSLDDDCDGVTDCDDEDCVADEACVEPEPYCGDGNLDDGEECDDGNNEDGDGCSVICTIEEESEPEPESEP